MLKVIFFHSYKIFNLTQPSFSNGLFHVQSVYIYLLIMSSANCQYLPRFFFSIFFFRSFSLQLLIPGPYQPYHPTATAPELIALIMLHPFSYDFSNFFTLLIYSFVILRFTSFCLIPLGFNIPKYCIQSPLTSPKTQLYMKNETLLLYATYS